VHSYTAINFCIYHKFLANNSLISTPNRMEHKSQYRTNSQTGKFYLRMVQSSCLQSLCGHVITDGQTGDSAPSIICYWGLARQFEF